MSGLWVWLQCESKKRPAPTMSPSEIQDGEEQAVMLELNVPDDTVLLSDFMLWHLPLNNGAICSKHESKEYEKCSPENQKDRMLTTWERIFDLDMRDPYLTMTRRKNRSIQGTIWLLRKEWLIATHIFNLHSEIKRIAQIS